MKITLIGATISVAAIAVCGCSPHEDPPKTPYIIATTPTYRATVNSTDPVIEPFYMTPGVNGGKKFKAPSIPAPDLFNANAPLAVAVYVTITHTPSIDAHYVTVEGKPHAIRLQGTVTSAAQKAAIAKIARETPGVDVVQNDIVVQQ